MTKRGKLEQANLRRTIELHHGDPAAMSTMHDATVEVASGTILNAVAYAATRGIGDLTIVNSILQFSAVWLHKISTAATANQLRLMADQLEAAARGDEEAEARICEAIMINGLAFTAARDAKHRGGRN